MEVRIKSKKSTKKLPIAVAERWLNFKKVNPSQTWALDEPGFEYKDGKITKKPVVKAAKVEEGE